MTFEDMLPTLQSQASRIFNGDEDFIQDTLAMAYRNSQSHLKRKGRELSIGECVNFIKYRASELKNGKRPHFGNISEKSTEDVCHRLLYLTGQVELASLDYEDEDNEEGDRSVEFLTLIPSGEDEILFKIDLVKFLSGLSQVERKLLGCLMQGFNCREIADEARLKYEVVRKRLREIGRRFCEYSQYKPLRPC
jgi:DNA-directed RNA polymerase specialized sigma24 family protein